MQLEFKLTRGVPDEEFWVRFQELWSATKELSPFKAQHILRYFVQDTKQNIMVCSVSRGGGLRCLIFLKEHKGHLTFLSDLKTDVNHFLFRADTNEAERTFFFDNLFAVIKKNKWTWTLNNLAGENPDMALLELCAERAGLFHNRIPYSARPFLEADSPAELFEKVSAIKELRIRMNRLRKRPEVEFEVLTDDRDLPGWVKEFCDVHLLRWANTDTPSHLDSKNARTFLEGCLQAWAADGLLVRFAIKVDGARIGFVVGLRKSHKLVHHSTTYHPDHAKASPGKAIILFMAEWMAENGYRVLDFGDGREEYKYTVATQELPLHRIFISGRKNLRYILSTKLIERTRKSPALYGFYQKRIKRLLK